MICQKCGKEIPDNSLFCPECGMKQTAEQAGGPAKILSPANAAGTAGGEGMSSCPSCGARIPAGSRFCPECRAAQPGAIPPQPNAIPPQSGAVPPRPPYPGMNSQQGGYVPPQPNGMPPTPPQKPVRQITPEEAERIAKRNKKIAIGAGAVAVVCLLLVLAAAFMKPSINLNNYLKVAFEGYDTVGRAEVTFDYKKFDDDYGKKLSSKAKSKSSVTDVFLSECVNGSLDRTEGLSNGDVVAYTWDCDDDYALEEYGYKLKYQDTEYTVDGLKEAEIFDPFDGIEVLFEGISPDGYAEVSGTASDEAAQDFNYQLDTWNGLKNGDTVTVTASIYYGEDPVTYCIENYGKIPSPLEKEYTVDGLDSFVSELSEVSEESLKEMQAQAEDVYRAAVAKDWGEGESLSSLTYLGDYLLTSKNSSDNALYLVYQAQVRNQYANGDAFYDATNDVYWYITFYDLLVNPSGETTVDITNYRTPGDRFTVDSGVSSGWWSTKTWYYYGYQTLEELYKRVVTSNADSYNHEDNVDEGQMVIPMPQETVPETPQAEESSAEMSETEETAEGAPAEGETAEGESAVNAEQIGGDNDDGFIFPNSSQEVLDEAVIHALSNEDLRYAINEIYARHGYIFNDDALRSYYEQYDWYEKKVSPGNFSDSMFNDVERENIKRLQKERDGR